MTSQIALELRQNLVREFVLRVAYILSQQQKPYREKENLITKQKQPKSQNKKMQQSPFKIEQKIEQISIPLKQPIKINPASIKTIPLLIPAQQKQPALSIQGIQGLEKLDMILADTSVQGIECPGPDIPININHSGLVKQSNITLSKEEIDSIIKNFSEKTRIPIVPGVFKAILGNLTLTAVVSDFINTRFILQKRVNIFRAT